VRRPIVAADVHTNPDIAADGAGTAPGADIVFAEVTLLANKYNAAGATNLPLNVSVELLQDALFQVGAFVDRRLGERDGLLHHPRGIRRWTPPCPGGTRRRDQPLSSQPNRTEAVKRKKADS
jgi:hypothetical protein